MPPSSKAKIEEIKLVIPEEVTGIIKKLKNEHHEAYIVGGCVRDVICSVLSSANIEPYDWDVATSAKPEEIQRLFPDHVYENTFGTVAVKTESENPKLKIIEVTTFRVEGEYNDNRRPDKVTFVSTIKEDLARRDFTINAIALDLIETNICRVIDPYDGIEDIKRGVVRAVGNPQERFEEDALRLMRAVRIAVQLGFAIESETAEAARNQATRIKNIAIERVRVEFEKLIISELAPEGVILLEKLGLLEHIIPELREGIECAQNQHHIYSVFEHLIRSLDYAVKKNAPLEIRLAVLFHDIGKPRTKRGEGKSATFYSHEIVGARMTQKILTRMKFSNETIERVTHLVRYHMFYYNVDEVSPAGVRRFLARIGVENVDDFLLVREADRIGSGVPKAAPYKLRHLRFMIEKVRRDPVGPKMLKINGSDIMSSLGIEPGPVIGQILAVLLDEVLEDPKRNERDYLEKRTKELHVLNAEDRRELVKKAKEKQEEFESDIEQEIKKKYYV